MLSHSLNTELTMSFVVYANGRGHVINAATTFAEAACVYLETVQGEDLSKPALIRGHYRPRPFPHLRLRYGHCTMNVYSFSSK